MYGYCVRVHIGTELTNPRLLYSPLVQLGLCLKLDGRNSIPYILLCGPYTLFFACLALHDVGKIWGLYRKYCYHLLAPLADLISLTVFRAAIYTRCFK